MAAEVAPSGPFEYTATGVLGDQRNSMLINELHLRDKLGTVRTRGFELPSTTYTYGMPGDRHSFSAAHALRGWAGTYGCNTTNKPPELQRAKTATERDYMSLNRKALDGGLVTTHENSDYRALHDIRRVPFDQKDMKSKLRSRRLPPTMVFGIRSRPSTPIFDLIEHRYQDKWIKERQQQLNAARKAENEVSKSQGLIYETRASLLRTQQIGVTPPPLWKLPRFTRSARPHIQTFRTANERDASYKHYDSDKIGRKGNFGGGIYQKAIK